MRSIEALTWFKDPNLTQVVAQKTGSLPNVFSLNVSLDDPNGPELADGGSHNENDRGNEGFPRWGLGFKTDSILNSGISAGIGSGVNGEVTGTLTEGLNVDLVPAGAQKGAFSLGLAASDVQFNLELNALEAEGRGEVVAQPKIVTADQSPASIQQGTQIPYSTVSDGGTNVQFQNAVLSLDVTPQITPDGNVIMELAIAQDSVGGTTSDGQIIIDTRKLNTTVLVGDGETIVLGGVFEETNNNEVEKVPVLGDLPLLGKLFRNKVVIEDKKELLVFITPKLINDALARR